MTDQTPPPIGHNAPPPFDADQHAALEKRVAELCDEAGKWLEKTTIEDETTAEKARDFIARLSSANKKTDAKRVAEKKPHDEASKAVQAAYAPLLAKIKRSSDLVKKNLSDYARKVQERIDAEREAARVEAQRKAEEARKAAEAAEKRHDVSGNVDAEAELKAAEKALKKAEKETKAKVGSYSGAVGSLGMRTYRAVTITNINQLFLYYRDRPEVAECLQALAQADVRAKDVDDSQIPGIEITEEKRIA